MTHDKETIRINISMNKAFHGKLLEIAEHFSVSVSEVVRRAISEMHVEVTKQKFGYKGTAAPAPVGGKLQRAEAEIRAMSPEQLNEHMHTIGYLPADGLEDPYKAACETMIKHRVIAGPDGGVQYVIERRHFETDALLREPEVAAYSIEDIIELLRSAKKLKV